MKNIVYRLSCFLFLLSLTATAVAQELVFPPPAAEISAANRATLDPWSGRWAGTFDVYDTRGTRTTRLSVSQHYWWDGAVQRATFVEVDANGTQTTANAANYQDAAGNLVCTVEKSNGERSLHVGTVTDGYLFWHANRPDTTEVFKERVEGAGEAAVYAIDGFGVYGGQAYLFSGRYARPE